MLTAARDLKWWGRELARAQAKLQKERDAAIRKVVRGGMPAADVGEAFAKFRSNGCHRSSMLRSADRLRLAN